MINFRSFLGKIFQRIGIKQKMIQFWESILFHLRTIQMFVLTPFDNNFKRKNPIMIRSIEETLQYIYDNKCSVSRFGDGEFNIISNNSIGFQQNDSLLVNRLQDIVSVNGIEKCLICLPGNFIFENEYEKTTRRFFKKLLVINRKKWYSYLNRAYTYGNADITRCYIEFGNKSNAKQYFSMWKKIWNEKKLCIVEGEKTRLGVGNDLFSNADQVIRILCPATDAFSKYDEILQYIINSIDKE